MEDVHLFTVVPPVARGEPQDRGGLVGVLGGDDPRAVAVLLRGDREANGEAGAVGDLALAAVGPDRGLVQRQHVVRRRAVHRLVGAEAQAGGRHTDERIVRVGVAVGGRRGDRAGRVRRGTGAAGREARGDGGQRECGQPAANSHLLLLSSESAQGTG